MVAMLGLLAIELVAFDGRTAPPVASPTYSSAAPAQTSPAGLLGALIEAGTLSDLYHPNFSDYRGYLRTFYQAGDYHLAWVRDGQPTPQAMAMTTVFVQAGQEGLAPEDYDGPYWTIRLAQLRQHDSPASPAALARFDLEMTVSTMRYISDLHLGRVNPQVFNFGYNPAARRFDLARFTRTQLIDADPARIPAIMAGLEPPFWVYRRMQKALLEYEELAKNDDGRTLAVPAATVNPGDVYADLPRLVWFLRLVGDLPPDASVSLKPAVYQEPLVSAVKHFQARHGLAPDGRLGVKTFKALNVPLTWRVEQLRLAMERWRWVPQHFSHPPVIVNIPEFMLRCWNDDYRNELQMRIIVGKAYRHKTPVFYGQMRYVIFRPYWNVPASILHAELLGKIQRNPGYLAANRYEVVTHDGSVVTSGVVTPAILARLRAGQLEVRQRPGPKNALGLVKFIFPNDHNVYLHSTPLPQLFNSSRRDFSHGCIRVQDPVGLAVWALRQKPGWDRDHVLAAMNGTQDNLEIRLDRPIPVLIVYGTAFVSRAGVVEFFDDIYGYDSELARALAAGAYPPG